MTRLRMGAASCQTFAAVAADVNPGMCALVNVLALVAAVFLSQSKRRARSLRGAAGGGGRGCANVHAKVERVCLSA